MHLKFRNVNDAFSGMVRGIHEGSIPTVRKSSRNGDVWKVAEPILISYQRPRERVLFNERRDCNPAFHLYEALWMLAGRNDVEAVATYAKQMREYSDDGRTLNGAYGYRWRNANARITKYNDIYGHDEPVFQDVDQLDIIANHLKADPNSRRAVLQMWNVEDDLQKIGKGQAEFNRYMESIGNKRDEFTDAQWKERFDEWNTASNDVCCNLSVMFSIREEPNKYVGAEPRPTINDPTRYLDMAVTNRSNDLIWGLFGANFVHFSFLQEYMAARIGVEVGEYHVFSNDAHVYSWNWKPDEWLGCEAGESKRQYHADIRHVPLVRDPATFDREVKEFAEVWANPDKQDNPFRTWEEPFLETVASPMLSAFLTYKRKGATTSTWVERIAADDWRIAARGWIERRLNRKEKADERE